MQSGASAAAAGARGSVLGRQGDGAPGTQWRLPEPGSCLLPGPRWAITVSPTPAAQQFAKLPPHTPRPRPEQKCKKSWGKRLTSSVHGPDTDGNFYLRIRHVGGALFRPTRPLQAPRRRRRRSRSRAPPERGRRRSAESSETQRRGARAIPGERDAGHGRARGGAGAGRGAAAGGGRGPRRRSSRSGRAVRAAPRPLAAAGSRAASPSSAPGAAPGITGRCKMGTGSLEGAFYKGDQFWVLGPGKRRLQRQSARAPGSRQLGTGKGRFTKTIGPGLRGAETREGASCKDDRPLAPGSWTWRRGTVAFPAPEPTETSRTLLEARVTFRGRCHPHSQGPGAV